MATATETPVGGAEGQELETCTVYFNRDPNFLVGPLHGLKIGQVYDSKYGLLMVYRVDVVATRRDHRGETVRETDGMYRAVRKEVYDTDQTRYSLGPQNPPGVGEV